MRFDLKLQTAVFSLFGAVFAQNVFNPFCFVLTLGHQCTNRRNHRPSRFGCPGNPLKVREHIQNHLDRRYGVYSLTGFGERRGIE
jgi:hypothetical protein